MPFTLLVRSNTSPNTSTQKRIIIIKKKHNSPNSPSLSLHRAQHWRYPVVQRLKCKKYIFFQYLNGYFGHQIYKKERKKNKGKKALAKNQFKDALMQSDIKKMQRKDKFE